MPTNVLEENSRQMDQHKKRLVFHTLIGNSKVCAEVHALQSGGDGVPERRRWASSQSAQLRQILRRHTVLGFVHHYTDLG